MEIWFLLKWNVRFNCWEPMETGYFSRDEVDAFIAQQELAPHFFEIHKLTVAGASH